MCGITGVHAYQNVAFRLDEATLWRMTDSLAHRGPDGRGVHLDPAARIGLGHRRLSIIDLSPAGAQPMTTDEGATWIVYNGEVYNHRALRAELEGRGVHFRSQSDTEVILRLYEAEGDACVERLVGMFAFAIWDGPRRRLFLARDRIGVKPLLWSDVGGHLLFASEPRALLHHPLIRRELDPQSLSHALTFLSTPVPGTMFAGIHKLPAGHRMVVDERGPRIERWWSALDAPRLSPDVYANETNLAKTLRGMLDRSVEERMMSDVPFGVFLSGGLDSSANVALMARHSDGPVQTFSVGYRGRGVDHLNELEHARRIAQMYGAQHHEVVIDHKSVIDYLPQLVEHLDEPVFDPVCVPLYYVSKLARESGIRVIQVGEGSDELFVGYEFYLQAIRFSERLRFLRHLSKRARDRLHAVISPLLLAIGHRAVNWEELLRRALYEDVFWGGAILAGDRQKAHLLRSTSRLESGWSVIARFYDEIDARSPEADTVQRMTYVELCQRLPELLLARVDKITMAASIEGREPFLTHPLVEFALRLPQSVKIRGGRTKAILKDAVADLLPEDLLKRRKQGFPAPMSMWFLEDELGDLLARTLESSSLVRAGYFDGEALGRLVREHRGRHADHGTLLWTLALLSLWHRRWIEGRDLN